MQNSTTSNLLEFYIISYDELIKIIRDEYKIDGKLNRYGISLNNGFRIPTVRYIRELHKLIYYDSNLTKLFKGHYFIRPDLIKVAIKDEFWNLKNVQAWKVKIELRFIKHKAQELSAKNTTTHFQQFYDELLPDVEITDIHSGKIIFKYYANKEGAKYC
jgi:hypothetical protein